MSTHADKAFDHVEERSALIEEMVGEHGPNWAEAYKPGSFGCHELLDRASLLADLVDRHLVSHPACVQNPEWYALAEQASFALNELYQQVGKAHLADPCDGASSP